MILIFNDMGSALSVKSCYSKFLSSIAVIALVTLLGAAFLVEEGNNQELYVWIGEEGIVIN